VGTPLLPHCIGDIGIGARRGNSNIASTCFALSAHNVDLILALSAACARSSISRVRSASNSYSLPTAEAEARMLGHCRTIGAAAWSCRRMSPIHNRAPKEALRGI
jgi:hypothetical protein